MAKRFIRATVAILLFSFSFSALAATESMVVFSKGMLAFSGGEFKKALPFFQQAYKADPKNTDTIYLLGMTYLRLNQSKKASAHFKELLEKNPEFFKVYFDYGLSLYRQQKFKEGLGWLEKAHAKESEDPNPLLYIGLSQYQLGEREKALGILKNVAKEFSSTPAGAAAGEWVTKIESEAQPKEAPAKKQKRLHLRAAVSGFYDSNVMLDPQTENLNGVNGNQDAPMVAGSLEARYFLTRPKEKTKLFAEYFGYQSGYFNIYPGLHTQSFNNGRHKAGIQFQRQVSDSLQWRLPIHYTYQTLGVSEYVHSGTGEFTLDWGWLKNWVTTLTGGFRRDDFFIETANASQSRDAMRPSTRIEQYYFFPPKRTAYVKVGGEADVNFAEGADWDYISHRALFGFHTPLVWGLDITAFGNIGVYKHFLHVDSAFNRERADFSFYGTGVLSHNLTKHWSTSLVYSYTLVDSNIERYTYRRQLMGATLAWAL